MYIPKGAKLEEVCSKDKDRPIIGQVHYNAARQRLEAADGWIAAFVPVHKYPDPDDALPESDLAIPPDVYKTIQKDKCPQVNLTDGGLLKDGTGAMYPQAPDNDGGATFPDLERVTPKDAPWAMCFDVAKLYRLAKAICFEQRGTMQVDLYQDGPTDAILVKPMGTDIRPWGVIMPLRSIASEEANTIRRAPDTLTDLAASGEVVNLRMDNDGAVLGVGNRQFEGPTLASVLRQANTLLL